LRRDEELLCNESAVKYVQEHRRAIEKLAAGKIRFTPYDMEDAIQEAYAAALIARKTYRDLRITFNRCFWGLFVFRLKSLCCTSVRARRIMEGEQIQALVPIFDIHQREDVRLCEELMRWSISVMYPRQAQVWKRSLSRGRPSTEAIAKEMRIRRQSVEELQKRGLGRVRKKVVSGGLPPELVATLENGRSVWIR
jgi:hypothetical protein